MFFTTNRQTLPSLVNAWASTPPQR
jgi:hypothetical protein